MNRKYRNLGDRILSNCEVTAAPEWLGSEFGPCLIWKLHKNKKGYGRLTVKIMGNKPRGQWVHRIAFCLFGEQEIPYGKHLDHLCARNACCNPKHMQAVDAAENSRRRNVRLYGSIEDFRRVIYNTLRAIGLHKVQGESSGEGESVREADGVAV